MLTKRQKNDVFMYLMKLFFLALTTAVFAVIWYVFYSGQLHELFYAKGNYMVIGLAFVLYAVFSKLYGGFDLTISRISELIYSHVVSILLTAFFMYVVAWLLIRHMPNVLPMLLLIAIDVLLAVVWSKLANRLTNRLLPPKRTVLVYEHMEARANGEKVIKDMPWRFKLVGQISAARDMDDVLEEIQELRAESVMICGVASSSRNAVVKYCVEHDIYAYIRPNIGDLLMSGSKTMQLRNFPMMLCRKAQPSAWYAAGKRVADIVLSLLAIVIASPFMLLTAIAVKAYDKGPVLYKQMRLTRNRQEFYVYKFRSMRVDAEKDGIARLASQDDDRITPIGKFIRACRIDELPQLFNILNGSMSIVGPRPERPEIAAQYEEEMPEFGLRLQVKAGLTGYAQVYGKYNTTPYEKLQMDLLYIGKMGLVTDLKIMFATIKILFMKESTQGIESGQITAAQEEKREKVQVGA